MPDEAINPAPDEDTPAVETEAPAEDTQESPQVIDWEKRYTDLRSFHDRRDQERQQELEEYRQRLDAFESQQRPDLEDDDYDEEDHLLAQVLENQRRLEAQLAQQSEQATRERERAEANDHINTELDAIEGELGAKLSDRISKRIAKDALAVKDEFGRPDVRRAYAEWRKDMEVERQGWVESKPTGGQPANGPGAVEVPDLDDPVAREDYINRMLGEE